MFSLAALKAAGDTVANSRALQWVLGGVLVVIGFMLWLARHEAAVRKNHEIRLERKSRKVQSKLEETLDEKSAQTVAAERDAPRGVRTAGELPESTRSVLIRD